MIVVGRVGDWEIGCRGCGVIGCRNYGGVGCWGSVVGVVGGWWR